MTVLQIEHRGGTIVRVKPDRPRPRSTALHRETDLRSIPPLLDRLDDLGVADVELGDPPQRLPHDRLLGNELRFVGDVLQLAAAAVILHVVGARCGNAGRAGGDDLGQDRKSTRLNSSHGYISYAVFCLKKKKTIKQADHTISTIHDPSRKIS